MGNSRNGIVIKTDIVEDGGISYASIFWIVEKCAIWFDTQCEADKRKKEIEYKMSVGQIEVPTWDCVEMSEEAKEKNSTYIIINKEVERVSKRAIDELDSKDVILVFPSTRKNNNTVRVLKTPKTGSSIRKVFIPKFVAMCLAELKKEQDELIEVLGGEYQNYNLVMATTFGLPLGESYLRDKIQKVINEQGLPDVVFHSIRHTSVTYKLKLSGGDIKAVQGDSGHAQADMVTEV